MFRRKRRKALVRWLPDNSCFSEVTGLALSGPTQEAATAKRLIQGTGGAPTALLAGAAGGPAARMMTDNVILDHIKGKLSWNLEGNNGVEGSQDADGMWLYVIRCGIWIAPKDFDESDSSAHDVGINVSGGFRSFSDAGTVLNPGADGSSMLEGSFGPDGLRVLWRRAWFISAVWNQDVDGTIMQSNEDLCPPGPYLDIKPKRLLRSADELYVGCHVQALPGVGASGTSRLWWGHDLRVAAHNTARRR